MRVTRMSHGLTVVQQVLETVDKDRRAEKRCVLAIVGYCALMSWNNLRGRGPLQTHLKAREVFGSRALYL